jgi:ElaB/YqjD/DUF883 family membrane-anchored ribosome-binding protein
MSYPMKNLQTDVENLAEDAGHLIDATATAAGARYDEACKGLSAVLERGKDLYGVARKRAVKETHAADVVLHDNLYQTVLIGIGVGALLGYLVARKGTGNLD